MRTARVSDEGLGLVEVVIGMLMLGILAISLLPALGRASAFPRNSPRPRPRRVISTRWSRMPAPHPRAPRSVRSPRVPRSPMARAPTSQSRPYTIPPAAQRAPLCRDAHRNGRIRCTVGARGRTGVYPMTPADEPLEAEAGCRSSNSSSICLIALGRSHRGGDDPHQLVANTGNVLSETEATNRGQLVSSAIERAVRNALAVEVIGGRRCECTHRSAESGVPGLRARRRRGQHDAERRPPGHTWPEWQDGIDAIPGEPSTRGRRGRHRHLRFQIATTRRPCGSSARSPLAIRQESPRHAGPGSPERTRRRGRGLIAVVFVMLVGVVVAPAVAARSYSPSVQTPQTGLRPRRSSPQNPAAMRRSLTWPEPATPASSRSPPADPRVQCDGRSHDRLTAGRAGRRGVATGCPTADTTYVVISSTGTGADGSSATVDAVYPWIVSYEQQAGGVLAYFANGVSLRGTYAGDIVVRSGDYTCAADGTLDGDLYVTRGSATFSRDCTVYGDVWTYGDVDGSSQRITIAGNVKAGGTTDG